METGTSDTGITVEWALSPKWPARSSSDVVRVVRANDGLQLIMVDVQGSGASGTRLARDLAQFCASLLDFGAAGGTALAATAQRLAYVRDGKVMASLLIAQANAESDEASLWYYGHHLAVSVDGAGSACTFLNAEPAGLHADQHPGKQCIALPHGTSLFLPNDGVASTAPQWTDLVGTIHTCAAEGAATATITAAIARDGGRAKSDMAVGIMHRSSSPSARPLETGSASHFSSPRRNVAT